MSYNCLVLHGVAPCHIGIRPRNPKDGIIPVGIIHINLRKSILRKVDKKSKGPQRERGLEFSMRQRSGIHKEEERINFFFSPYIP